MVERVLVVGRVVGYLMVDSVTYFSSLPVLHGWYNKYTWYVYHGGGMVHIKDPLLLIEKIRTYSEGSGFPFSLFEWSFICSTPYNRK